MKKFFALAVMAFIGYATLSCKCDWRGNFLEVGPYEDLVVKAKVLKFYKAHSDIHEKMEVEVIKVLKGKETRRRFMVWGDDGKSCRPYISNFKKGRIYYLAINPEEERPKDYEISICGEHYLLVQNNQVQMKNGTDAMTERTYMGLDEFEKALLHKINGLD